jgi:hypothetical protein
MGCGLNGRALGLQVQVFDFKLYTGKKIPVCLIFHHSLPDTKVSHSTDIISTFQDEQGNG